MDKDRELLKKLCAAVQAQGTKAAEVAQEACEYLNPKPEFEYALESLPAGTLVHCWDDTQNEAVNSLLTGHDPNTTFPYLTNCTFWKHIEPLGHPWIAFKPNRNNDGLPPVNPNQKVQTFERGLRMLEADAACNMRWRWDEEESDKDTVAYRIVTRY
jgi:hypothetical protein